MTNETYECGQRVKVLRTGFFGQVMKVDEQNRCVALDLYRELDALARGAQPDHVDVPYTFDEVVLLQEDAAPAAPAAPVHFPRDMGTMAPICGAAESGALVTPDVAGVTCLDCKQAVAVAETVEASAKAPPTLRERMRVRSVMPELDDIFVSKIDFPGTVVRPGQWAERTFAPGRECRVAGISKPKGLRLERVVLKVGPDFRAVPKKGDGSDPPYTEYAGKDCLVYRGDEVKEGAWKKVRLAPEHGAGIYLLAHNETADDLKFEGTIRFEEDRVPTPDHEEV